MGMDDLNVILEEIQLRQTRFSRDESRDANFYNWGVVLTLCLSGGATIAGSFTAAGSPVPPWLGPALAGLATIWVGIDRALQWGPRWMFNRGRWAAYESLRRRINTLQLLPSDADRQAEIAKIRQLFVELPKDHLGVPGVATTTPRTK